MRRAAVILVLAGAVAGVTVPSAAQASHRAVVPVHGSTPCKPSPPHLLSAGRAPLAPLRQDLSGIAHHVQNTHWVETVAQRVKLPNGAWRSSTEITNMDVHEKGGAIARGKVALSMKNTVSFPATKTTAARAGGSYTLKGQTDPLSGGLLGGTAGNDRLPVEAVGIGAAWRIVDCDYVNQTPAKEIRTYTLRSIAHRVVVLTFRDVVSMDPTQRDLGSQKIGTETVHAKLDRLRGTASGTYRVALASAFRSSFTQVTKVEFTFHLVSKNVPATPIVARLVDTQTNKPVG
jgi:hypothetical protein